jgi:probable F420-dependent oxidoreductase
MTEEKDMMVGTEDLQGCVSKGGGKAAPFSLAVSSRRDRERIESRAVKFGIQMFATDEALDSATLAQMVEERGFESLFLPEHTHIPASRRTPYPPGGELPREYYRTVDPFVGLSTAAAATKSLKVGTGICLVVQRDPIITAKEVASIDHLSGGRFLFGVGAGWNEEEMEDHGTNPRGRWKLMRERIEAMKEIWTKDEASYHGEYVNFDSIFSWPKPVQKPHPPILVGGNGPKVRDRVVAFGDEWLPNRLGDEERFRNRMVKLQAQARDAGREIRVTLAIAPTEPDKIKWYEEVGVHRCLYWVPPAGRDVVERALDKYTPLVEQLA